MSLKIVEKSCNSAKFGDRSIDSRKFGIRFRRKNYDFKSRIYENFNVTLGICTNKPSPISS